MAAFVSVAKVSELQRGRAGKTVTIDDTCLHRGGPLGEGELEGCIVVCPATAGNTMRPREFQPSDAAARVACYATKDPTGTRFR